MSKALIERLREAAAQRVASTAMIGAEDLSAAADALEQIDAAYASAVEAGKSLAQQAFKAEQERDAIAEELKALREQEPVAWVNPSYAEPAQGCTYSREDHERWPHIYSQPLYARPVPGRELTDADIALCIASADKSFAQERISGKPVLGVWSKHLARAIERHLKGEGE